MNPPTITRLAEQRLEQPRPGDSAYTNDNQTKYRLEVHPGGGTTFHRAERKLSKAEKKAAKKARRR